MTFLKRLRKGRYQVYKTALGCQRQGKDKPKIYHKIFFIKSNTQKVGGVNYEYGIIHMDDIRTKPYLMGKRVKIIVQVVEPCTKK